MAKPLATTTTTGGWEVMPPVTPPWRRQLRLGAAWIGVTVTAVATAWFGLRPAIDSPTGAADAHPGIDNSFVVRTVTSPKPAQSPTAEATAAVPTLAPSPSATPSPSPVKESPRPSPSRSAKRTPSPPPTTRTVELAGGVVELERRNGRVEVTDVSVKPQFSGQGWREQNGTVVIEFRSRDHKSTLRAFVRNDCGLCADVEETKV